MGATIEATRVLTAEEFAALPDDGRRLELVRGEVIGMAPAGGEHSGLAVSIAARLLPFAKAHGRGHVTGADGGWLLARDPDTVRVPDAAYLSAERLERLPTGIIPTAPDLAVEVVSPTDRKAEVMAKVSEYLAAGVQVVWVVWPAQQVIEVHLPEPLPTEVLGLNDVLTCEGLLPGFAAPLREIFA